MILQMVAQAEFPSLDLLSGSRMRSLREENTTKHVKTDFIGLEYKGNNV